MGFGSGHRSGKRGSDPTRTRYRYPDADSSAKNLVNIFDAVNLFYEFIIRASCKVLRRLGSWSSWVSRIWRIYGLGRSCSLLHSRSVFNTWPILKNGYRGMKSARCFLKWRRLSKNWTRDIELRCAAVTGDAQLHINRLAIPQ
jgi:hypothetical protein